MKIPNPFLLAFRLVSWPIGQLLYLAIRSVRLQTWLLTKFVAMGAAQGTVNQIAGAFNQMNHDRGIPAKFILPDGRFPVPEKPTVEQPRLEDANDSGEAKP